MSVLRTWLEKIADERIPLQTVVAEVTSVDKDKATCDVKPVNGDAEMFGVRLKAVVDDDIGVVIYPEQGSKVLVTLIENQEAAAFVSKVSTIESALITIENKFTLDLKSDGTLEINGGDLGGLIKIQELVNRLNSIEQKINKHIQEYNAHTHTAPMIGSTGPKTPQAPLTTLSQTQKSQLEDDQVTH